MTVFAQSFSFRDYRGRVGWLKLYQDATSALVAASHALTLAGNLSTGTNAHLERAFGPYSTAPTPPVYGANGAYPSIEDICRIWMRTAAGSILKLDLPCPLSALFQPDQETGILTSGAIFNIASNLTGSGWCTRDGVHYAGLVFAARMRRGNRRKLSSYLKNSSLSGPDL